MLGVVRSLAPLESPLRALERIATVALVCKARARLDPSGIGDVTRRVAAVLAELSDQGRDKHLLIRGPVSLAVLIGAAGYPMGRTTVPFWATASWSRRRRLRGRVGLAVTAARMSAAVHFGWHRRRSTFPVPDIAHAYERPWI